MLAFSAGVSCWSGLVLGLFAGLGFGWGVSRVLGRPWESLG